MTGPWPGTGAAVPSPGQDVLGLYLRCLRERAGLRLQDVAGRYGMSVPVLRWIERGTVLPTWAKTERMLREQYQVPAGDSPVFEAAKALVAAQDPTAFDDLPGWYDRLAAVEHQTSPGRSFHVRLPPPPLCTPRYAQAVRPLREWRLADEHAPTIPRPDSAGGPMGTVVLDYTVLRRPHGGHAMFAEQLRALMRAVDERRADLRVLAPDADFAAWRCSNSLSERFRPGGRRLYVHEDWGVSYTSGLHGESRQGELLTRAVAPAARFWDARELLHAVGGDHALSLSDLAPVAAAGTNLLFSGRQT
ncbi:Scr1 family TA system antitoxin-like transcriptional regulator [Streptomyces sp. BE147]|uniref:Scr1 family TA system antitoxin-like transcriptional regulator n=1 Tax=Streptomyces sp. BE147 TaxID=3002524 RepID=UPI002E76496A|nr:Scr1 family TA system antitoxin-like transcriptional regulator [Streptomyces sp. BE147]MEE1742278.1 Scr1 family TA system antitoxin-like transcriptional regulator [Streptomyces sp. BE147]